MGVSGGLVDGGGGGFREEDHPRDPKGEFASKGGAKGDGGDDGGEAQDGGASAGNTGSDQQQPPKPLKSLSRPNFHAATDEERKERKVPPAWTDVHVSDNPKADIQAIGRDEAGRQQSIRSTEYTRRQIALKFERNLLFHKVVPSLLHHFSREVSEGGRNAEEASVLRLIDTTGARVGGEGETQAKVKAYGTTTLLAKHVTIEGDSALLDFIGKMGKRNLYRVDDPDIVADLSARVEAAKTPEDRLFQTNDGKCRDYLGKVPGGAGFKVHDFRTERATETARAATQEMEPPTSPEEYWKRRDEVGRKAAAQINDTLDIALSTYVNPIVFDDWRTRAGVAADAERPKRGKGKTPAAD